MPEPEHFSWVLLEGQPRAAPPILDFKNGRYKVGEAWFRAAELQHSSADLDAARSAAASVKRVTDETVADMEIDVGDHYVGEKIFARGNTAAGESWFEAEVLTLRSRFPPVQVKYKSNLEGETSGLVLPSPIVAFVPLTHIRSDKPSPPAQKRQRCR